MEYLTLTRNDPEFDSYIRGTFSKEQRALSVETFWGPQSGERVTFQLVPLEKIERPSWWVVYFKSSRPDLLPLTLGPAVAVWLNHLESISNWAMWPSWFALAGIFFLHTAAFLFNDYQDYISGSDRVNTKRGSRVIQKGWATAHELHQWSKVNFVLAALLALPAILNAPLKTLWICVAALMSLLVISKSWGRKWGLCDFALVLLFGPLLTCGTALASFAQTSWGDAALGLAFGTMALWVFHVRQLGSLFRSRPEMFHTGLAHQPFDRARAWVVTEAYIVLALQISVALLLPVPRAILVFALVGAWPLVTVAQRVAKATSPVASPLEGLAQLALKAQWVWALWWAISLGWLWL